MKFLGVYDYTVILTYASLVSAVCGMMLSAAGQFTAAVLCLLASGICDAFDGVVARSKSNRTEEEKAFGIQLDSLCDTVSFGVFPAMLCFHLGVQGVLGWLILSAYCVCGVMRLACFNVLETRRQAVEDGTSRFFHGIPITSSALVIPLVFCFRDVIGVSAFPIVLQVVLALLAFFFILDFPVPKPDVKRLLPHRRTVPDKY